MILFIIVMLLLGYGCVYSTLARAGERPKAVLRHLALIVRQNLPLTTGLRLAATSETGAVRRVLNRTARLIDAGAPLAEALELAYPGCPAMPLSIVKTAQQMGTLPSALHELNQRLAQQRPRSQTETQSRLAYLSIVALACLSVLVGLAIYI